MVNISYGLEQANRWTVCVWERINSCSRFPETLNKHHSFHEFHGDRFFNSLVMNHYELFFDFNTMIADLIIDRGEVLFILITVV